MSTLTQPRLRLPPLQLLSLVIPARDEEGCVAETVSALHQVLHAHHVPHEIVVVDDGSRDGTWKVLEAVQNAIPELHPVKNEGLHGFGRAVECGIEHARGDAVVICMADASDTPDDVVTYWKLLNQGYECVFGSRFMQGSRVVGYPRMKLLLNRVANFFIKLLFRIPLNDTTNAFKAYRREVIDGCGPILSSHFNLTGGATPQGHRSRVLLDRDPDPLDEPEDRSLETEAQGDGKPVLFHCDVCMAGEIFQPWRLSEGSPRG